MFMQKQYETTFELPAEMHAVSEKNMLKIKSHGKEAFREFNTREMTVGVEGNNVVIKAKSNNQTAVAKINAFVSHLKNICLGLKGGFEYKLEIVYSHFPINIAQKEKQLEISNVGGAKKPRTARIVGDTVVTIKGKDITVKGSNKEHVGQTAANLEQASKIKGKDTRVFQDGIYIVQKDRQRLS